MQGCRNAQRILFRAQCLSHQVSPDSFYGPMCAMQMKLLA